MNRTKQVIKHLEAYQAFLDVLASCSKDGLKSQESAKLSNEIEHLIVSLERFGCRRIEGARQRM